MTVKRIILCILLISVMLCMTACGEETVEALPVDPDMPVTTEEIVRFYNDSIGRAADSRMSFAKRYKGTDDKFNISPAVVPFKSKLKEAVGMVKKEDIILTPESAKTETYTRYLRRPTLTEADVKKAESEPYKGGLYRIKISLRDGGSRVSSEGEQYKSSLDKCGIAAGESFDDKSDHLSAQNVREKLSDIASQLSIDEKHSDGVITALFRPDGTPVKLDISFNKEYNIKGVYEVGMSAKIKTEIKYRGFGSDAPSIPEEEEDEST